MVFIHRETFEIYKSVDGEEDIENKYFECDELIAEAIQELNRKGYETEFSCSGHWFPEKKINNNRVSTFYSQFYISFKEHYNFDLDLIPGTSYIDGKILKAEGYPFFANQEMMKKEILTNAANIITWAKELPHIDELDVKTLPEEERKIVIVKEETETDRFIAILEEIKEGFIQFCKAEGLPYTFEDSIIRRECYETMLRESAKKYAPFCVIEKGIHRGDAWGGLLEMINYMICLETGDKFTSEWL